MKNLSANAQYTIGMSIWMVLYVAALFCSIYAIRLQHPTGPFLYGLAVLPALPIGGTIFVFLRYMEQVDEYLRSVITRRFVVATGFTLFICTAWGFLEDNAGAHHVSLYLIYPLFWILFAVAGIFHRKV